MINSRRNIEYRGKSKKYKKWIYGGYFQHITRQICPLGDMLKDDEIQDLIFYDSFADWNMPRGIEYEEVDYKTLGRYLEMKDNHKNKIYEDDIIEFTCGENKERYLLYFNKELSHMSVVNADNAYYNGVDYYSRDSIPVSFELFCLMVQNPYGDYSDIKVIGNRHDNPELITIVERNDVNA